MDKFKNKKKEKKGRKLTTIYSLSILSIGIVHTSRKHKIYAIYSPYELHLFLLLFYIKENPVFIFHSTEFISIFKIISSQHTLFQRNQKIKKKFKKNRTFRTKIV